jgi:hypothetical protein
MGLIEGIDLKRVIDGSATFFVQLLLLTSGASISIEENTWLIEIL